MLRNNEALAIVLPSESRSASHLMVTMREQREQWCEKRFGHDEERSFKPNELNFRV